MTNFVISKQGHQFLEDDIPEYMHEGLIMYLEHKILPGSFLEAVLSNDLFGAVMKADSTNVYMIPKYIGFLYLHAPAGAWGSPEKVEQWLVSHDIRNRNCNYDPTKPTGSQLCNEIYNYCSCRQPEISLEETAPDEVEEKHNYDDDQ